MTELNAQSDRMVLIISCKVKDADSFKTWSRDRASKYVYDLKEEKSTIISQQVFNLFNRQRPCPLATSLRPKTMTRPS